MDKFKFSYEILSEAGKNFYNEWSSKLLEKQKEYLSDERKMTCLWLNKKEVHLDYDLCSTIAWLYDNGHANCYQEIVYGDDYVYRPLLVDGVINEENLARMIVRY